MKIDSIGCRQIYVRYTSRTIEGDLCWGALSIASRGFSQRMLLGRKEDQELHFRTQCCAVLWWKKMILQTWMCKRRRASCTRKKAWLAWKSILFEFSLQSSIILSLVFSPLANVAYLHPSSSHFSLTHFTH